MNKNQTHKLQWNRAGKDILALSLETTALMGQVVLCFLFYNSAGLDWLLYLGWGLLAMAMILGWRARVAFERMGKAAQGQSWLNTTVVIDRGIYAIVRHPMYLSFMLIVLGLAFISQHWLSVILGITLTVLLYDVMRHEEKVNVEKFGDDYVRYMQVVPRVNIIVGITRFLRRERSR
jgi:protein-S-isoprenylcysteine O-methyltransferase Ste14